MLNQIRRNQLQINQIQKSLLSVGGYPFTGKAVIEARRKHGEHWTTKMRYLHDRRVDMQQTPF